MSVSNEPLLWLPFSGGGTLAALLVPAHLVVLGLVLPLAGGVAPSADAFAALASAWVVRLYLLVFVGGCLLHAAHRLRYLLAEVGMYALRGPIAVLCYAGALLGIAWTCLVLF